MREMGNEDEGEKWNHYDAKKMEQQKGKRQDKFDNRGKNKERSGSDSETNYSILK